MTHYGRPKRSRPGTVFPPGELHGTETQYTASRQAAGRILALGGAMIAGFFLLMTVPQSRETADTGGVPEGAVAVMSTAVAGQERVTLPENSREEAAGAEPFGYMDGEWNLWEYIGDLMWSLLS